MTAILNWLLDTVEGKEERVVGDDYSSTASGPPSLAREGKTQAEAGISERLGTLREEILREAIKCVCTDRNEQYGEPEDNFSCIAEYWQKSLSIAVLNTAPAFPSRLRTLP